MPFTEILSPLDQPLGKSRLLLDLESHLHDTDFNEFKFIVAFAKVGPLLRLEKAIKRWVNMGNIIVANYGIDHNGTSLQALSFSLENFSEVFYTHYINHSFHPKVYCFKGKERAVLYIGSNNLTVGGTEINFESYVKLSYKLDEEHGEFSKVERSLFETVSEECPATRKLTSESLSDLLNKGLLLDETTEPKFPRKRKADLPKANGDSLDVQPASPLPREALTQKKKTRKQIAETAKKVEEQARKIDLYKEIIPVKGFCIQIIPHHNGEIFLSTTAIQQNPKFFGMPFTGRTVPKNPKNEPYYQREPDPVCNIKVIGENDKIIFSEEKYSLNTVFYTKKSEIRITASPLVQHVPPYSLMVMKHSPDPECDYELLIHTPESNNYEKWLVVCNQTMPSGGKPNPRRFGWF